jgi:hypothetical protein
MHVSTRDMRAWTFLGLSSDALKAPQVAVNELPIRAEGDRRARLEAVRTRRSRAIEETEPGWGKTRGPFGVI